LVYSISGMSASKINFMMKDDAYEYRRCWFTAPTGRPEAKKVKFAVRIISVHNTSFIPRIKNL